MTETETASALYDRIRRDSNYGLSPYRTVVFVANMMKRDPFAVLNVIGVQRVADDDAGAINSIISRRNWRHIEGF